MSNNPPNRNSRRKPTQMEPPRVVKEVPLPPSDKPVLKVETPDPDKYKAKAKIGTPTLGRSPNYVTKVGLGNLEVITVHGNTDV